MERACGARWISLVTIASGIYFTEPYDPTRVPVLLVYGIGGTPQDFRYFSDHFDRKRYQVWIFHYPSGMRLERVARAMGAGLDLLKQRYGFKQCDVVAHSMGGLVARAAIDEAVRNEGSNFIPKFVSISTPWGGHAAASAGIRRLKKPVHPGSTSHRTANFSRKSTRRPCRRAPVTCSSMDRKTADPLA